MLFDSQGGHLLLRIGAGLGEAGEGILAHHPRAGAEVGGAAHMTHGLFDPLVEGLLALRRAEWGVLATLIALLPELGTLTRRQIASLDEAREMFEGDEAVVQQLIQVFLRDHERTIADVQRAAAGLDYKSLGEVGHAVKGSVGLFCARRVPTTLKPRARLPIMGAEPL